MCTVKYNEVTTLYSQNDVNQIGGAGVARPCALPRASTRAPAPLGIYTDNSATRTTQGFQPIREKFKLLHFARKLLPKERTAHCFYNRITKEEGVSVFLNKLRNKANYGNVMRCANPWACPVCSAIISEGRKDEVKTAMD